MKMLSASVVLLGVALVAPAVAYGQDAAAEKMLLANERAINEAVMKGDVAGFKERVAADSWAIDSMMGRTSTVDFAKTLPQMAKDLKVTSFDLTDPKTLWVDANTAVLMYKFVAKGTYQGQPMQDTYASTVYNKRGGKWIAVFHQESQVMPAPAKK